MINNLWRPSPEEAPIDMYYDKQEAFMATIAAATANAKTAPFVIVSTSRTQAKVIHKHCLAACPDIVIKKYNSDLSAADRKDFDNIPTGSSLLLDNTKRWYLKCLILRSALLPLNGRC